MTGCRHQFASPLYWLIYLVVSHWAVAARAGEYRVIALEGTSAGAGNGSFSSFRDGILNDQGHIAFTGYTSQLDDFFAVAQPEAARLVARQGLAAPGMPSGVTFGIIAYHGNVQLNNENDIAFLADVEGLGSSDRAGIWAGDPDDLRLVAQWNDVAPGTGGERFDYFDTGLGLADGGYVAFVGHLQDFSSGIWAGTQSNLQLVALEGGPVPGVPGWQFKGFRFFEHHADMNRHGRLAFYAIAESTATSDFTPAIWSGTPANMQLIAREGLAVPGFGVGAVILSLSREPQINDANEIAFAVIAGPESGESSDAIFVRTSAGLEPVYRLGETPPGFPADTKYDAQWGFHLGGQGKIVFHNWVETPDEETQDGLFAYDDGEVRLVARDEQLIPNASQNLYFDDFTRYYINQEGRVAFMAEVAGDATQKGIWVENSAGDLIEVARTGTEIEIAGVVRTLTDIDWPDVQIGYSPLTPYNASGQVLFEASFDGLQALVLFDPGILPGDFNGDGTVDAADYVVWRKSGASLQGYNLWRANFGRTAGGTSTVLPIFSTVPEPATGKMVLLLLGVVRVSSRPFSGNRSRVARTRASPACFDWCRKKSLSHESRLGGPRQIIILAEGQ